MMTETHNLASPPGGEESLISCRSSRPGAAGFFMGVNMDSLGWVKLHRKMKDWEWYTSANTMRVFVHLLLSANHAEQSWMGISVKRGQVICGRNSLSRDLKISQQSIKTALRNLKSTSEIAIQSTNRFSIITICNYDTYQLRENKINQQNNQPINKQSTSNQPATNHKQEGEEGKNDKNTDIVELALDVPQVNGKEKLINQARAIIAYLNETAVRRYRETDSHLKPIMACLKSVDGDIEGVKAMISRQVKKWGADPKMMEYLTPQTLFGKSKFQTYYDNRNQPIVAGNQPQFVNRNLGTHNEGKEDEYANVGKVPRT